MDDTLTKNARYDPRLEVYESFYDHDWGQDVEAITDPAPKLHRPLLDLAGTWKGVSRARALPHLAMLLAETVVKRSGALRATNSLGLWLSRHIAARVEQRVALSASQREAIVKALLDLHEEYKKNSDGHSAAFPVQELWSEIIDEREMQMSLWASQLICYSAVYFAYEDFLVRCIGLYRGDPTYRCFGVKQLVPDFRKAFGEPLTAHCVTDRGVTIARLVRNALVHNGGRETDELRKLDPPHGLDLVGDEISILPDDVKNLFDLLKVRTKALAEHAAAMPEFK